MLLKTEKPSSFFTKVLAIWLWPTTTFPWLITHQTETLHFPGTATILHQLERTRFKFRQITTFKWLMLLGQNLHYKMLHTSAISYPTGQQYNTQKQVLLRQLWIRKEIALTAENVETKADAQVYSSVCSEFECHPSSQ